jgi:hypothetical protein
MLGCLQVIFFQIIKQTYVKVPGAASPYKNPKSAIERQSRHSGDALGISLYIFIFNDVLMVLCSR